MAIKPSQIWCFKGDPNIHLRAWKGGMPVPEIINFQG